MLSAAYFPNCRLPPPPCSIGGLIQGPGWRGIPPFGLLCDGPHCCNNSICMGMLPETSCVFFSITRITHNDRVPELLAVIRRGPFAEPTETEQIEYLFTRVRAKRDKMDFENYAFEHVLSYQRRIQATKEQFMRRNKKTPLGVIQDWWDRTPSVPKPGEPGGRPD